MNAIAKIEVGMVGASVAGFIALALVGRFLQTRGYARDPAAMARVMFPFVMGLFLLFGLGLIGLGMQLFIAGQGKIGNAEMGMVSFLRRHQVGVTIGVWAFLLTGFAIAFPFMRRDMLGPAPATIGPSAGVLRADIGQTMDQVRAASTLTLAPAVALALDQSTQATGQGVFDFELPGGRVRFEQCRYYFITTGPKNDTAITSMNIGISPAKKPKAQIDADEARIRAQLVVDHWTPGRFVWRGERELRLHGDQPTTGEGRYWAKGGTLLILSSRRMDEARAGEDPRTAGEFILVLDLVSKSERAYDKLEFGPRVEEPPPGKP